MRLLGPGRPDVAGGESRQYQDSFEREEIFRHPIVELALFFFFLLSFFFSHNHHQTTTQIIVSSPPNFPTLLAIPNVCRDQLYQCPCLKPSSREPQLRGFHDAMMT